MRPGIRLLLAASAVLANLAATPLRAQGRIVEDVVASEQRGYVSVTLLFSCSMRYLSHTPATDGEALQVRFSAGPDCGRTSASEPQPLLAGAAGFVRSVDVVRPFGSEVQVRIGWSKPETFVLTPSIDGRLLRVRLLRAETPQVTVRNAAGHLHVRRKPGLVDHTFTPMHSQPPRSRARGTFRRPSSTSSAGTACGPGLSSTRRQPGRHWPIRAAIPESLDRDFG
jgi:hypothetical protein